MGAVVQYVRDRWRLPWSKRAYVEARCYQYTSWRWDVLAGLPSFVAANAIMLLTMGWRGLLLAGALSGMIVPVWVVVLRDKQRKGHYRAAPIANECGSIIAVGSSFVAYLGMRQLFRDMVLVAATGGALGLLLGPWVWRATAIVVVFLASLLLERAVSNLHQSALARRGGTAASAVRDGGCGHLPGDVQQRGGER